MQPEIKKALVLRVQRHMVETVVLPFDKLYFFPTGMDSTIARVFPYSLVLYLTPYFVGKIQQIMASCTAYEAFPLRRKDEKVVKAAFSVDTFENILKNDAYWVAVVPMLYTSKKTQTFYQSSPTYISGLKEKGRKRRIPFRRYLYLKKQMGMLQTMKSYLLVAGEAYRPVCIACPNHLEMINGRCFFGSKDCYQHLSTTTPTTFLAGIKAYKEFVKAEEPEPELEDLLHE